MVSKRHCDICDAVIESDDDDDERPVRVVKKGKLYFRVSIELSPLDEEDDDDYSPDDMCPDCEAKILEKAIWLSPEEVEKYTEMREKAREEDDL